MPIGLVVYSLDSDCVDESNCAMNEKPKSAASFKPSRENIEAEIEQKKQEILDLEAKKRALDDDSAPQPESPIPPGYILGTGADKKEGEK